MLFLWLLLGDGYIYVLSSAVAITAASPEASSRNCRFAITFGAGAYGANAYAAITAACPNGRQQ